MPDQLTDLKFPEITYPLAIDTIGKCIVTGHTITAHCHGHGCHKATRLNLVQLARRLGIDHSSMALDLIPHLFCADCRAAGRKSSFSITIGPCYDAHSAWPRRANALEAVRASERAGQSPGAA